jgi:RNA polymerase primary sigma factor
VRQKILIALARHGQAMTLPQGRASDVYRVHKAQAVLRQALQDEPSLAQLVAATGLTRSVVEGIVTARRGGVISLRESPSGQRGDEGGGRHAEERIESALLTGQIVEDRELTESVNVLLAQLPARQELIVRLYFGLDGGFEFTLEEIAHAIGITRERVRQLRDQRLRFLAERGARLRPS